jgi:hypothetical protein
MCGAGCDVWLGLMSKVLLLDILCAYSPVLTKVYTLVVLVIIVNFFLLIIHRLGLFIFWNYFLCLPSEKIVLFDLQRKKRSMFQFKDVSCLTPR